MLLFSSGTFTVDGITVFPDHADPNQFWYLPGPVGLANLAGSTEPQFLLIMYAPDVASSGVKGVGFLNVTVALKLSDTAHAKIMGQIWAQFPNSDNPNLSPVPFDDGSVQIVALDLQGGGGTNASLPAGAFEAVEHILGATSPELFGENDALFALTLSEDGASILQAAFKDNMAPVGVIYSMKFTGARPAIDVKITADLKRCYESFSADVTATVYYISAGIDAGFEKLRQDGAIKVEVTNLTTDAANAEKEQWALSLFKDSIMSQWFTPSLSPTTAAAADASSLSLTVPNASSGSAARPATGSAPTPPATTHTTPPATTHTTPPMGNVPASGSTMRPATPTAPAATTPAAGAATTPGAGAATTPAAGAPPAAARAATAPASAASAAKALPGTAAAASSGAAPFGVALRLKFVSQDELKTVEIDYSRMDAVQRVYAPQGYFGLMLNQIDQSKHFLQVDGTDPFFHQFAVTVNPPHDFTGIGLLAAHVAIDYGDPATPTAFKHGEFLFDPAHTTQQVWQVHQGVISTTQFQYIADYKFDPESGWNGEQTSYTVPTVTTENRVLNLDPHDFLGFLQVMVSAGRIDANLVDRIEVALSYTAPSGWSTATTLIVRPGSAPQSWKLRTIKVEVTNLTTGVTDKIQTAYTYATTCYLKDGTAFPTKPVTSTASAILVSDPFVAALDLLFEPELDPSTKLAIVELNYEDAANNYGFQTSFEIQGANPTSSRLHIPLVDRTRIQYQYRITAISITNQQSQGAYVTAQDPLILIKTSPPGSS